MVYGPQQINTIINYVMCPYPICYIPQYIYVPQLCYIPNPYYNYEPALNGYTLPVECIDMAIQTDEAENLNKSVQTNAENKKNVAMQSEIATDSISIQTINIENNDIEIQTNIFTLNSISVQTNIKQKSVCMQTNVDDCISTIQNDSQAKGNNYKYLVFKFYIFV